jgi:hypothetical protein
MPADRSSLSAFGLTGGEDAAGSCQPVNTGVVVYNLLKGIARSFGKAPIRDETPSFTCA